MASKGATRRTGTTPDVSTLLSESVEFLERFVVLPSPHEPLAIALWVAHTHAIDAADATPYLAVTSPEKQSGKTRLLEVLELLVARPWRVVLPSDAVMFRKIAVDRSTLLLDEVDAIFGDKAGRYEALRAMLNAGHRRGAKIPRCDGQTLQVREFEVFGPKTIAAIGDLPDTVADRSIPIRLARRARDERVEQFRYRQVAREAAPLRGALAHWAKSADKVLRAARPSIPESLSDRAADGWEPLLAVADAAGGEWPRLGREAAVALHGSLAALDPTTGVLLLRAIREIFHDLSVDRISTGKLVRRLVIRDEGPWADWWEEKVRDGNRRGPGALLARLLRRYGITSRPVRINGTVRKGYKKAQFQDAFSRYLPPE